jgi:S-DNA-T family DNA segregation ATPase FtsK/SpoIIIE
MYKEKREELQRQSNNWRNLAQIVRGICSIPRSRLKVTLTIVMIGLGYGSWKWLLMKSENFILEYNLPFPFYVGLIFRIAIIIFLLIILILILSLFGRPIHAKKIENELHRLGLVNRAEESPILIKKYPKTDSILIFEFGANGIPLSRWQETSEGLGMVLNRIVVNCHEGKRRNRIVVETVKNNQLPDNIEWDNKYMSNKDFELVLGVGYEGLIKYDMHKMPHSVIGGSTGSGKTVLIKSMVYQCHKKGATVYLADFKGGMDFPPEWKNWFHFITDEQMLINCLHEMVDELEMRKKIYGDLQSSCTAVPTTRMVLVCDEIAEILDKTGIGKEQKLLVAEIERLLSTIARLGRAFGIHLILGTQRPDMNILTGQIKSNIDFRVCGRADEVLSRIILDTSKAAEIPKDSQGRFMLSDGTVFQAFHFDAENL